MQKIRTLQDLRGIAILMVVFYHSGKHYTELVVHGDNGVLLFFIISGFIIASVHKKDQGLGNFITFMKKRIARIHFPYIPLALVFIFLFWFSGKGSEYHHDPINIIRNILLIQNPSESIHPYAWTLVFEMFYYTLFGSLYIILNRGLLPFSIALLIPPLVYYFFNIGGNLNLITSFNNLYFLGGVFLGYFSDKLKFDSKLYMVIPLFIVFLALPFYTKDDFIILISTFIFFIFYLRLNFNLRLLEKIGNASYTIYLSHGLILVVGKYFISDDLIRFVLLFLISIIGGYFYFLATENRLTKIGKKVLALS